ncbi:MAG TPA: hypothetical protein VES97_03040, partial [Solirubrobacteraceae bacterium]|nr:hypothetical protein [Solirubrobacteraceae bacterium]
RIGRALEPLQRRRGDLPRALTSALDAALAPRPADRGTLDQLRLALEETLEHGLGRSRRGSLQPRRPQASAEDLAVPTREPARAPRLALPRALWMGCGLAAIAWQALSGRAGVALLLLAAVLPLAALPRRAGPSWLAGALAPALGLAGLAGAFPAIAGQVGRWRERATLAALGYWWLTLAEPLLGHRLWLGAPPGTPARAVWEGSPSATATHVVGPLLSVGALLGATLWAAGAVLLPWIVRGRRAALDVVAVVVWSAAIAAAAPAFDAGLPARAANPGPHGAVLGAVLGGMLAVAARALRGPV